MRRKVGRNSQDIAATAKATAAARSRDKARDANGAKVRRYKNVSNGKT